MEADQAGPLLPRYRRTRTFGGLLDDTFAIYRENWLPLLVAMAAGAILSLLVRLVQTAVAGTPVPQTLLPTTPGRPPGLGSLPPGTLAAFTGANLLATVALFVVNLPSVIAVVVLTDRALRGKRLTVGSVPASLGEGVRKLGITFASGVIAFFGIVGLSIVSALLWAAELLVVGPLVALICLIVWAANPRARKKGLKWVIILTAPFGLATYVTYKWGLALPAIALEHVGPAAALRRSSYLTRGGWFRVFGVVALLAIIVAILQSIPGLVVTIPLTVAQIGNAVRNGSVPVAPASTVVVAVAANSLGLALFGSLPSIGVTLLFTDARNRLEGADLAERIDALGAAGERPAEGSGPWASPALG